VDIALANNLGNVVSVMLGNGDGTFGTPQYFAAGLAPWAIAPGDFNADGRPDLAVANVTATSITVLSNTKR
jgi:hypothetical protein